MYPKVILKGIFCVLPDNFLRFAWQATYTPLYINNLRWTCFEVSDLKLFPYKHSLLLYEASETSLTSPYQTSCCSYDTRSIAHTILNIPQTACSHLRSLPLPYLGRYCQKKSVDTSSTDFFYFIAHFRKKLGLNSRLNVVMNCFEWIVLPE